MSTATLALWSRFLTWLGHPEAANDCYGALGISPHSADLTPELTALFSDRALDRAAVNALFAPVEARLRAGKILFVPSYLSGPIIRWRDAAFDFDFLLPHVKRLRRDGFETDIVSIDSAADVAANARAVAEAIAASAKPVFIVTFSKGGLDTLHALIEAPALIDKVGAIVAMQAPFFGSPVADLATATPRAQWISGKVVRLYRGGIDAIHDLSTPHRQAYMSAHASEIATIVARCPILSVATALSTSRSLGAFAVRNAPTTLWIDDLGLANDGLVPVASAILPGAPYVLIDGLMHDELGYEHPALDRALDRVDLLKACMALALSKPAETGPFA